MVTASMHKFLVITINKVWIELMHRGQLTLGFLQQTITDT